MPASRSQLIIENLSGKNLLADKLNDKISCDREAGSSSFSVSGQALGCDSVLLVLESHACPETEKEEDEDTNRLSPLLYRKGSFEAYDREGKETAVSVFVEAMFGN